MKKLDLKSRRAKRIYIWTAAIGAPITALATGIGVGIAKTSHQKAFKVNIANPQGAKYVVTKIDPAQMLPVNTGENERIWDAIDEGLNKSVISSRLKISNEMQTQLAITKGHKWSNGLEKLIYDLGHVHNNGDNLKIDFSMKAVPIITFKKDFIQTLNFKERMDKFKAGAQALETWKTHDKTWKDATAAHQKDATHPAPTGPEPTIPAELKPFADFEQACEKLLILINKAGTPTITQTTEQIYLEAVDKIEKAE